jgi:hypothetical protein
MILNKKIVLYLCNMALPITIKSDYIGKVRVSTAKGSQFEQYITEYESKYIKLLTNSEVFRDIRDKADPLPQKYLDLINGVDYTDDCGDLVIFDGLKQMLLLFVYAQYNQDNFQTSIGGNVRSVNENSTVLTADNTAIIVQRYNDGVRLYRDELCQFLEEHEDLELTITSSVDNTGTYTLNVASTKYLSDGDLVTINDVDYTISNTVLDTSFDITNATGGLDFTADIVKYKPYYEFCPKHIPYSSWL